MVSRSGPDAAVTDFHPAYSSTALVILELAPSEGAENCTASVGWDGGGLQPLFRTAFYNVSPDNDW